jgi:hypothetical protein
VLGLSSQADGHREHDPISMCLTAVAICDLTQEIGVLTLEFEVGWRSPA